MLTQILLAVLNGVITYIVLLIIVAILGMAGLANIGAVVSPFVVLIALLVGILTFLGVIPSYWRDPIR